MLEIEAVLDKEIEGLAPMPKTLSYLARIQYEPEVWLGEVARVIEFDQALTANILRMANSAWSHNLTPIFTVKEALVRVGMDNVLNLALISSLATPMSKACPGYDLVENELFRHSILSYLTAESLSRLDSIEVPKMASTAALLHDIGKLILERFIGPEVRHQIRSKSALEKIQEIEAEESILGTNHAIIGMEITKKWNFPEELYNSISLHHTVDDSGGILVDIVKIGNNIAKFFSQSRNPEKEGIQKLIDMDSALFDRINLSNSDLALICITIDDEFKKIGALFGE